MTTRRFVLALLFLAVAGPRGVLAEGWTVDPDASVFAVLTRPAGPAARLAHPHLVVARGPRVELAFAAANPEATRFGLTVPVLALDADPAAERASLAPRLAELGVFDGELAPIDEGDRKKIRAAMLGAEQLFAERFPEVRAELLGVERRGGDGNARVALGWDARVRIEVRGEALEATFPLRWEIEDDVLTAEVVGEAKFTDFGIEPYSAVLGAIRNADLFHLYVRLVARRAD
jgi:hypothetical protein